MVLKLNDLIIKARLPDIPKSLSLIELRTSSLNERRWSIECLGRRLELGNLKVADVPHGLVFGSKRGEVEFFRASGSVWACNTAMEEKFENEERRWKGLRETGRGAKRSFALDRDVSADLSKTAIDVLKEAGLFREEATRPLVQLDQWAHLDSKGKEIKRGAGAATVKFGYQLEGLAVIGPGAKSLVFGEPVDGTPRISGVFHAWREVVGSRKLQLSSVEAALRIGLLQDSELIAHRRKKHRIAITRLVFGYMGLPAFMQQSYLFPAFEVEGFVENPDDRKRSYAFGKYYHAATAKQYAKADAAAHYLTAVL
jgi:hypothetical protein